MGDNTKSSMGKAINSVTKATSSNCCIGCISKCNGAAWFNSASFCICTVIQWSLEVFSQPLLFVGILRNVLCVFRWCSPRYRNPSAAVGSDLSRPHIRKHPHNGKRKYRFDDVKHTCAMTNICVFDNVNTRIW